MLVFENRYGPWVVEIGIDVELVRENISNGDEVLIFGLLLSIK